MLCCATYQARTKTERLCFSALHMTSSLLWLGLSPVACWNKLLLYGLSEVRLEEGGFCWDDGSKTRVLDGCRWFVLCMEIFRPCVMEESETQKHEADESDVHVTITVKFCRNHQDHSSVYLLIPLHHNLHFNPASHTKQAQYTVNKYR